MADMMIRFVGMAVTLGMLVQDPTTTLPEAYKVQFENDYVRMVRVHYDAGAKLAEHVHPAGTTVYVYLNDSEGVVFQHAGNMNRAVTRPSVKAGAIRVATGPEEHHSVENTSKAASDFLRIYLKTDTAGNRSMRRIPPTEMAFESKQLRVTRLRLQQHDVETIEARTPALLIEWPSGNHRWVDAGTSTTVENHDPADVNMIRIDFLTAAEN
jgi:hypothetical protein